MKAMPHEFPLVAFEASGARSHTRCIMNRCREQALATEEIGWDCLVGRKGKRRCALPRLVQLFRIIGAS